MDDLINRIRAESKAGENGPDTCILVDPGKPPTAVLMRPNPEPGVILSSRYRWIGEAPTLPFAILMAWCEAMIEKEQSK